MQYEIKINGSGTSEELSISLKQIALLIADKEHEREIQQKGKCDFEGVELFTTIKVVDTSYRTIELTDEEIRSVTQYKSFGQKWVDGALMNKRAHKYVDQTLEKVGEGKYATPYNCVRTGLVTYKRKDGQPITQDDLDAVGALNCGQRNIAQGKPGDMTLVHDWFCDSGD